MNGISNDLFSPQSNYTKEQAVVTVLRLIDVAAGNKIHINDLNNTGSLATNDMDVKYEDVSAMSESARTAALTKFNTDTGMSYDVFTSKIVSMGYTLNTLNLVSSGTSTGENYALHDYLFDFQTSTKATVKIAICSFEYPLRDYYIAFDNPETSQINGTDVTVYKLNDTYMISFSHGGNYFDIETSGVPIGQLQRLLSEILL